MGSVIDAFAEMVPWKARRCVSVRYACRKSPGRGELPSPFTAPYVQC